MALLLLPVIHGTDDDEWKGEIWSFGNSFNLEYSSQEVRDSDEGGGGGWVQWMTSSCGAAWEFHFKPTRHADAVSWSPGDIGLIYARNFSMNLYVGKPSLTLNYMILEGWKTPMGTFIRIPPLLAHVGSTCTTPLLMGSRGNMFGGRRWRWRQDAGQRAELHATVALKAE